MDTKCTTQAVIRGRGATANIVAGIDKETILRGNYPPGSRFAENIPGLGQYESDDPEDYRNGSDNYALSIDYPDGTVIDFEKGQLFLDGEEYQLNWNNGMSVKGNGDVTINRNQDGTPQTDFEYQKQYIIENYGEDGWEFFKDYANTMRFGSNQIIINNLIKAGVDLNSNPEIGSRFSNVEDSPLGLPATGYERFNEMLSNIPLDHKNMALTGYVASDDMPNVNRKYSTSELMQNAGAGKNNNKTTNKKNEGNGLRSNTKKSKDNGWYVVYAVHGGSGAKGAYLGTAQNEKLGYGDNMGNPYDEVTFAANTKFENVLVDKTNRIIIKRPVTV